MGNHDLFTTGCSPDPFTVAPKVLFVAFTPVGASLVGARTNVGAPDQLYGLSIGLKTPVTRQIEV